MSEPRIPTTWVDTTQLPPEEQFGSWAVHGVASRYAPVHPGEFFAQGGFWRLGPAVVTSAEIDPFVSVRDNADITDRPLDHIQVVALLDGAVLFETSQKVFDCRPPHVFVCDYREPYRISTSRTRVASVYIARSFLEEACGRFSAHGLLPDRAETGILASTLTALAATLPFAATTSTHHYARMLRELIAAAIFGQRLIDDDIDLKLRIEKHVATAMPERIDITRLCAEEAVSRSTLYRLFRRDGGLLNWHRTRRLRDLYCAISDPAERRTLGEVGAAYGFYDSAGLTRAFRRHFGMSPSQVRLIARGGIHPGDDCDTTFKRLRQSVEALSG